MKNTMKFRIDLYALKSSTAKCNLTCSYCHLDYFDLQGEQTGERSYELTDLVSQCLLSAQHNGKDMKLHFSGRADPLLIERKRFAAEIEKLRKKFPHADMCITTNGIRLFEYANEIAGSGIRKVNVSHHNYSGVLEEKVLKGIRKVRELGVEAILNVVATEEVTNNLSRFIMLGEENKLTIKFFNLITEDKEYSKALFRRFLNSLGGFCSKNAEHDTEKNRITHFTHTGNRIVVKLEEIFTDRPEECLNCAQLSKCDESCWDTIRITPKYIKPCGVRTDNVYFPDENSVASLRSKLIAGGKLTKSKQLNHE